MRHSKPCTVDGVRYPSETALRRAVDGLVGSGSMPLSFALSLLERHPYRRQMIGAGIASVQIVDARIVLVRVDGSRVTLMRRRMVDETDRERFHRACRQASFDSIHALKLSMFARGDVRCAADGSLLAFDDCDIDHAPPWTFAKIADAYAAELGASTPTMAKSVALDVAVFVDERIAEMFVPFHDKRAVLRPMRRAINRAGMWGFAAVGAA